MGEEVSGPCWMLKLLQWDTDTDGTAEFGWYVHWEGWVLSGFQLWTSNVNAIGLTLNLLRRALELDGMGIIIQSGQGGGKRFRRWRPRLCTTRTYEISIMSTTMEIRTKNVKWAELCDMSACMSLQGKAMSKRNAKISLEKKKQETTRWGIEIEAFLLS